MTAIELKATKYFDSGIYEPTFFQKHKWIEINDNGIIEDIEFDIELLTKVWKDEENLEGTEDEIEEQVIDLFWEKLSYWTVYFEPCVFDEEVALECSLIPFTYKGINLLALSGCGMNLSPKLDAYQVLTGKTIDRNSEFFARDGQDYFKKVIANDDLMNKINNILKGEK